MKNKEEENKILQDIEEVIISFHIQTSNLLVKLSEIIKKLDEVKNEKNN